MKTFDQILTEAHHTNKAISIAARLKGGINRLKAKIPGTQANKFQKIKTRLGIKEDELDEGRARLGKSGEHWTNTYDSTRNRKIKRAEKQATKETGFRASAKQTHYIMKKMNRENGGNVREDELGPNAAAVQKVRKNLKIDETIKPLAHGKIEKKGNTLHLRSTVGSKVTKKQHTVKEDDKPKVDWDRVNKAKQEFLSGKRKPIKGVRMATARDLGLKKKDIPVKKESMEWVYDKAHIKKQNAPKVPKKITTAPPKK